MGCYNKIGFHSRLPIMDGKKIVLFICTTIGDINKMDNSPIEIDELLSPICLPLYGDYDDYGCINNIVKDANVILLEKIYNGNVEELLSSIQEYSGLSSSILFQDDKKDDDKTKYISFLNNIGLPSDKGLCTTMELMDVYQSMINIINRPIIKIDKWSKGSKIGDFCLSKLGFTKVGEENYSTIYKYKDSPYYVSSRGYTPPSIILDGKVIWHDYKGLEDFIVNFNKIANVELQMEEKYISYTYVDASFDEIKENYDEQKYCTKTNEEIIALRERFKDNIEMLDFINNRMGKFNMFHYNEGHKANDLVRFEEIVRLTNPNNMCVYNNINILGDEYKDIVCTFIKFNHALRNFCGYYTFSSYGFQSINQYKEEFAELNEVYKRNIEELTSINEGD